jgi:hypothetical protein
MPLLPISRQEFIDNIEEALDWLDSPAAESYSSVLPPWAQTGPFGWPFPWANELVFDFGSRGYGIVVAPLLDPLADAVAQVGQWVIGIRSWFSSKEGDCESAEDFADAVEEYANLNDLGDVWAEE